MLVYLQFKATVAVRNIITSLDLMDLALICFAMDAVASATGKESASRFIELIPLATFRQLLVNGAKASDCMLIACKRAFTETKHIWTLVHELRLAQSEFTYFSSNAIKHTKYHWIFDTTFVPAINIGGGGSRAQCINMVFHPFLNIVAFVMTDYRSYTFSINKFKGETSKESGSLIYHFVNSGLLCKHLDVSWSPSGEYLLALETFDAQCKILLFHLTDYKMAEIAINFIVVSKNYQTVKCWINSSSFFIFPDSDTILVYTLTENNRKIQINTRRHSLSPGLKDQEVVCVGGGKDIIFVGQRCTHIIDNSKHIHEKLFIIDITRSKRLTPFLCVSFKGFILDACYDWMSNIMLLSHFILHNKNETIRLGSRDFVINWSSDMYICTINPQPAEQVPPLPTQSCTATNTYDLVFSEIGLKSPLSPVGQDSSPHDRAHLIRSRLLGPRQLYLGSRLLTLTPNARLKYSIISSVTEHQVILSHPEMSLTLIIFKSPNASLSSSHTYFGPYARHPRKPIYIKKRSWNSCDTTFELGLVPHASSEVQRLYPPTKTSSYYSNKKAVIYV